MSLQLANERTLNTLMKGKDELTMVRDWEQRCQVELGSDVTMPPRETKLWESGTQVRVFYGTPNELSSQSKWTHRRPEMTNVQNLPDIVITEGLRRIAEDAIQTEEHVSISGDPRDNTVYFDPKAPRFAVGYDTQLPAKGHVTKQRPMLGVGTTDRATHEETMELNKQAFKLAEEAAIRSESLTARFDSEQCSLPGCIPYECRAIRGQGEDGCLTFIHGDCANRRKEGGQGKQKTGLEWRKYSHDRGIINTRYMTVSNKEVENYSLDHVMSAFGHCMSGRDSLKMWALQVAATNDGEEWCEQVNRQELELRVAIVLAGIYTTLWTTLSHGL